jgi:hypothetical protein
MMIHLRAYVYDRRVRDTRHEYLYVIQKIINSVPTSWTKFSPAELHREAKYRSEESLLFTSDETTGEARIVQNAAEVHEASSKYHETIISIAAAYQEDWNRRRDLSNTADNAEKYEINDYVLLSPHRGLGGALRPADKLTFPRTGPY